jgi:hypothetical protein
LRAATEDEISHGHVHGPGGHHHWYLYPFLCKDPESNLGVFDFISDEEIDLNTL